MTAENVGPSSGRKEGTEIGRLQGSILTLLAMRGAGVSLALTESILQITDLNRLRALREMLVIDASRAAVEQALANGPVLAAAPSADTPHV